MMIDTNAYLGHFAFRRLRHTTAPELLKLMDQKAVQKALVSSADAILYRNPQAGNEAVAEQVKPHRDRLIPLAVINPWYAGWQDDLKICHEDFGMHGLRLYPGWHNYALADRCCRDLIREATQRKMLVSIPIRVEDSRQRHWLVDLPDVSLTDVADLVKAFPKTTFILVNGIGFTGSPLGKKDNGLPANYYIEISRLSATLRNELAQLVGNLGAERIVFGTGMPFKYADPALLKLKVLDASEKDKEKIRWQNAAELLQKAK